MLSSILAILCICIAVVHGGVIHQQEPMELHSPSYEYHYSVHDDTTGDVKDQFEHRRGDYLVGRYSFIEPDGYRRIVEYTSEPLIGFTAHVRREPAHLQHR